LPRAVGKRVSSTLDDWGDRLVSAWTDWIDLPAEAGDRLAAAALGAGSGQVLVTDSVTVNLYKLASAALDARRERSSIVIDADDFPTDRYVVEGLAAQRGLELCVMCDAPPDGHHLEDIASMCDACSPALVVLSHVNYRTGALLDMHAVTSVVQERGALMLWDLSHSVGAVPIQLDDSNADMAVGCTYKYLNSGPGAPAFLYVRAGLHEGMRSPIWGWFGQRDQFEMGPTYEPEAGVARFLAGTPSIIGIAAVDAAVDLIRDAGIAPIREKSVKLTELVVDLHDAWLAPLGFELGTPRDAERRGSHVSIQHPDAWQLCRALIERAGVVPDFRVPDSIRIGLSPLYTRFVDVWDAVDRLRRLVETDEYREVATEQRRVT
ncbi:MAG: kynureninase, partial [Gaiellaceae bacterium]